MSLEGGIIPGHGIALYPISLSDSYESPTIHTELSTYTTMGFKLKMAKILYINGDISAFEWAMKPITDAAFYPFRVDFNIGAGFQYRALTIGWNHGCFHPIAPNINISPYGKIDAGYQRFFIRAEIKKELFKEKS
jgi:hypothetical protein